ncbi:MAG TPA: citrate/2-methylcitrate synthase [Herpetosiphonaceae bacterium]|nr:citrate/2-methylcitrate synthase [Herpetosiphonaceae bacterium]
MEHPWNEQSGALSHLEDLIAQVLHIPKSTVTDDLEYQSIMEWDSLSHINLMLALETTYGISIDPDTITHLNSVVRIRSHILQAATQQWAGANAIAAQPTMSPSDSSTAAEGVHRGLTGVIFDRSRISLIDGQAGKLLYRGYSIHDLATRSTFEETAYLLLFGQLPLPGELADFSAQLKAARAIPLPILDLIQHMRHCHPMMVLRTAISMLAAFDEDRDSTDPRALQRRGIRLIAQTPTLVAAHQAIRTGKQPPAPHPTLGHAANFLYMLQGAVPDERAAAIVDRVLILHADHSSNASAFAARVVAGTRADFYAALTAAAAAFAGPLHGGALEQVMTMLEAIGAPERAADYVAALRARNEPVMGFGHRVYQTEDPRAHHLREAARALSHECGEPRWYAILEAIVAAMRPYIEKGIDVNVDFYASVIYHLLGLPADLFVPAFVVGRMPGWIAQIHEQYANNILIRPLLKYVGAEDLTYQPLGQRGVSATTAEV